MDNDNSPPPRLVILIRGGAVISVHGTLAPQKVEVIDVYDLHETGLSETELKKTIAEACKGLEKLH